MRREAYYNKIRLKPVTCQNPTGQILYIEREKKTVTHIDRPSLYTFLH